MRGKLYVAFGLVRVLKMRIREFIKSCYEMIGDYSFIIWVIMMLLIGLCLLECSKG